MIRPARMEGKTWEKISREKIHIITYVFKFKEKGHST
jgi:hypothetical protein